MVSSGGDWVRSTEETTPCTAVVTPTELPEPLVAVAVSLYWPSGHCVPSVPLPFQVKGWLLPAVAEYWPVNTVWPLLLAIETFTVALLGTFRSQVAVELVSAAVSPLTTAVSPTNVSAWVDCAVCRSDTSVLICLLLFSCGWPPA